MNVTANASTPPPALTWTHLFPSGTAFDCPSGPEWFRQQLAALPGGGGSSAHVLWNTGQTPLDNLARFDRHDVAGSARRIIDSAQQMMARTTDRLRMAPDFSEPISRDSGIVAVNCRLFPAAQLKKAGYAYQRHFAAIPNLRNARWFVPLDTPAVSSAALSLYTPTRFSAKLKRGAVRIAMHSRVPVWYRDHVWIAQRECPPIETAINPLFPGRNVRWALSSGAPEGARNRKASALVLSSDGQMLAFVKLARSEIAKRILAREAQVLEQLAKMPAIAPSVPELLFSGEIDQVLALAQKPLHGDPAPLGMTAAHRQFLQSLQTPVTVSAADTSIASGLQGRLRALPTLRPDLADIHDRVMNELRQFEVPMTIIHGDFAPWNLRADRGRVVAFDWEYGELHGLPLIDEIHYRLQCGWLLEEWTTQEALDCLDAVANQRPLGLQPMQVEAISTLYLLDTLVRLLAEGYEDDQDVISWHRRLLDHLMFRSATSHMEVALA
jgi:hypothetical protein